MFFGSERYCLLHESRFTNLSGRLQYKPIVTFHLMPCWLSTAS